jgi:hypothetical protein
MSKRARLIEMIVFDNQITKNQNLLIVQDLLSLSRRNFEVMYRFEDELIDELCSICHVKLFKKARDRSKHIHNCRRKIMKRIASQYSFFNDSILIKYCFVCFRWFQNVIIWKKHCRKHFLFMNSLWCEIQTYCHVVINSEFCILCLSDERISASKRLRSWTRNYLLMKHVEHHIKNLYFFKFVCFHSLCDTQMKDLILFKCHLNDVHELIKS